MKKNLIFAALAALTVAGFSSCNNEDAVDGGKVLKAQNGINFQVTQDGAAGTRGTATTSENFLSQIGNFQVIAFYNNGSGRYVGSANNVGVVIDGDGAGAWTYHTPTQQQYWPAGALDFQAITPASDASFSLVNTVADDLDLDSDPSTDEVYPRLTANVTVPATVTDQKDIMFAVATNVNNAATGNAVGLTFKHALSQVVFQGKVASTNITAQVSEITVCNVHNTGNVGFRSALNTLSAAATGSAASSFSVGLIEGADAAATTAARTMTSTDAKNLTNLNGALMMIPQSCNAWTHTAPEKSIEDATGAYLKVKCTVTDNTSSTVLINNDYVYIPFDLSSANTKDWQLGKKYTYTLIFGNGSGGYDENGDPITSMVPITYTVSAADDWTPVDGGNVVF